MRARAVTQPRDDVGDLLAHRGRARGLAMRAAEHRHRGHRVRHRGQLVDDAVQRRQQHLFACGLQHQRMAGVVDVLAGAGEVHELARRGQFRQGLAARLEPVLDRLDVVVGGLLDVLDRLGVGLGEAQHEVAQQAARRFRQGLELGEAGVGQGDEPLDLDLHAAVHQAELRQQRAQRGDLGGIATVQRRQRADRGEGGGRGHGRRTAVQAGGCGRPMILGGAAAVKAPLGPTDFGAGAGAANRLTTDLPRTR